MSKKKVMIVDDSAVVRQVLKDTLEQATDLEVVAVAQDPLFAQNKLKTIKPDVIVLDIEMPRMDGLSFLKQLMADHPIPVVMCSTLTEEGSSASMKALSYGAVGLVAKPKLDLKGFLTDQASMLIDTVRSAAHADVRVLKKIAAKPLVPAPKNSADVILAKGSPSLAGLFNGRVVAIGTSTGGTLALEQVLPALPAESPPIVVVQHMPEKFTAAFADRLDKISKIQVREAQNGDEVLPGRALIAPGGKHMLVKHEAGKLRVEVLDGPLVSRHKPSVDVLFRSMAKAVGRNALGIIMTGMGDDGAAGLKEMHDAGAITLGQNKETCVVYGMPDVAMKKGAVERELPLDEIATEITRFGQAARMPQRKAS